MRMIAYAILALAALFGAENAAPQGLPDGAGQFDRMDEAFDEAVANGQFAGAVVLVQQHGELEWLAAYGSADVGTGRAIEVDDVFRIASMTKPVTSAAVLMLYEDGRIDLDDPVGKYLPAFDKRFDVIEKTEDGHRLLSADGPITIRQLLTHTSGLSYGFMNAQPLTTMYHEAGIGDGFQGETVPLEEFVKRLAAMPLLHEPGEAFSYGLSTDVLGRLVEVVSGRSFDVFLDERLFEPLGMNETWFEVPDRIEGRMPAVHRPGPDGKLEVVPPGLIEDGVTRYSVDFPYDDVTAFPSGGAGLSTTAEDYARFLQMILNGGTLDGTRVLDPETVNLMLTDQLSTLPGGAFGNPGFSLGLALSTRPRDGEDTPPGRLGWSGFFNTLMWIDPEKELLAILMTQHYPYGVTMLGQFPVLVYDAIED